jgi:hypothetical protein
VGLYSKRSRLIFLPWAIAVCLLCTGSLINFHQHKIWGFPLVPQLIAHKKDIEKTQTDIVLAKISTDKDISVFHFNGQPAVLLSNYTLTSSESFFICRNEMPTGYREFCIHSLGLRAPPLS